MILRRGLDVGIAIIGLLLVSPLLLFSALLIWLNDRGPIFFVQERVGWRGQPFRMYKMRTMSVGAENAGGPLTVGADRRITGVGAWLRRLKLDEFPQLFNVICGDMALVGPRPEVKKYVEHYTINQRQVLEIKPGVTDPASLKYYNESEVLAGAKDPEAFYVETIMPDKIKINLAYAEARSLGSDLRVIAATALRPLGIDLASARWQGKRLGEG